MRALKHFSFLLCAFCLVALVCADDGDNKWPSRDDDDDDDDDEKSWFERVDVPLTFDSGSRYVVGVAMSTAPVFQNFSFIFTTGTGMTYVAAAGGNFDRSVPLYNQTASPSSELVASSASESLLGQTANMTVVKETCALNGTNGRLWQYENQTLFLLNQMQPNTLGKDTGTQLGQEVSGIVGLGTNRGPWSWSSNSSAQTTTAGYKVTFEDSIIGQWFGEYKNAKNFTFGLALKPPSDASLATTGGAPSSLLGSEAGVMHLMEPDSSYYVASTVKWVNATVPKDNSSLPSSDWLLVVDGWQFNSQDNALTSKGQIVVDIDPIYTGIYIPQDQATLIHAAIAGSSLAPSRSTLGTLSEAWTIPCDSAFTFGLIVDGQSFVLDHTNLVIQQPDGTCISAIEGWTNSYETRYLLGSRFMSTVYLIFNVPRDGTSSIGIASRAGLEDKSSQSNLGAIVGGSVGGAALLVLTAFGIFYLRRLHIHGRHPAPHVPSLPPLAEPKPHPAAPPQGWQVEPFSAASPVPSQYAVQPSPVFSQYTVLPQQSPGASQHLLTPMASPNSMMFEERNSMQTSPPSYQQTHLYLASSAPREK